MDENKEEEVVVIDFISTSDCAARKGVSRQAVIDAIKRGVLPARKIGPNYIIRLVDCEAYTPATTPSERGKRNAGKPKPWQKSETEAREDKADK